MSNANEPAFAAAAEWHPLHEIQIGGSVGLTKRELFAAMAMQGFCSSDKYSSTPDEIVADMSKRLADALLAALEETK